MKKEVLIGLFGIITLAGFIWSYKFLQGSNLFSKENTFHVSYNNVANLDVSSQVQIKGYKVGNVTKISLDPNNVDKIQVSFSVKEDIQLPKNTIAAIKTGGVMGEKSIELLFSEICTSGCAQNGDKLTSGSVGLMASMLPEEDLDIYISKLTQGAQSFVDDMKSDTSTTVIKTTMNNIEATSLRLMLMTDKLNRVIDKSSKDIAATMANSASITSNLANNNIKITEILASLQTTLQKINSKIDKTFDGANESIVSINTSLKSANTSFIELNTLLSDINKGDGTLNKLVHDKKMADDLQFALENIGLLLQDLRLNPKRYVDISVFGKKQKKYNTPESDPAFKTN